MKNILIIDLELGNLKVFEHKLKLNNFDIKISSSKAAIKAADILILPGVGNFAEAMNFLIKNNLIDILNYKVLEKKTPIFGICLGLQLFTEFSEEGNVKGLGWIKGITQKFRFSKKNYKVPHIGWNTLNFKKKSILLKDIIEQQFFYFIHSYYLNEIKPEAILTTTNYGIDFVSSIEYENIASTQFHPEKSHKDGLKIIFNFLEKYQDTVNV